MQLKVAKGQKIRRDDVLIHLVHMHYKRNDYELVRTTFRVRGDVLEIMPAYEEKLAYRIEFFGDEVERLSAIDALTGKVLSREEAIAIFPGSHPSLQRMCVYTPLKRFVRAAERAQFFESENKLIERQAQSAPTTMLK
jgi:excinuclease ABC subunit B